MEVHACLSTLDGEEKSPATYTPVDPVSETLSGKCGCAEVTSMRAVIARAQRFRQAAEHDTLELREQTEASAAASSAVVEAVY